MFSFLTKPKIQKVLEDQLYEAQRARIDAIAALASSEAQVVAARTAVLTAKAQVAYTESRVMALDSDIQKLRAVYVPQLDAVSFSPPPPAPPTPERPWTPALEIA